MLSLLPSRITAWDAQGERHAFTVVVHWDGGFHLHRGKTAARWPGPGTVVALAPQRCLRRRLRQRPQSQDELRALAADLFPFDLGDAQLALHQRPDGLDVCLLAEEDKAALSGATAAVLAEPGAAALAEALRQRLTYGEVFDFLPAPPRLISPAPVFAAANLGLLAAAVALTLSLLFMGKSAEDRALRAELLRLQEEAAPLTQRRQTTANMARGIEALAAFSRHPNARLAPEMMAMAENLPPGTLIDKIALKDQRLSLSGLGNEAKDWLRRNNVTDAEIEIKALPKIDRFLVTRSLKDPVSPP